MELQGFSWLTSCFRVLNLPECPWSEVLGGLLAVLRRELGLRGEPLELLRPAGPQCP